MKSGNSPNYKHAKLRCRRCGVKTKWGYTILFEGLCQECACETYDDPTTWFFYTFTELRGEFI